MQVLKSVRGILIFLFSAGFFLAPQQMQAQEARGIQLLDADNRRPLPFVHIRLLADPAQGRSSDGQGYFRTPAQWQAEDSLRISHVGYQEMRLKVADLPEGGQLLLQPSPLEMEAFTFYAGENPALALMRRAIAAAPQNDPNKLPSYRYESYQKTLLTRFIPASWYEEGREFEESRHHAYIAEITAETWYKKPGRRRTTILSSQSSGLSNPIVFLASQEIQPFSFYEEHIDFLEEGLLNPLSTAGLRKYDYYLEDSIREGEGLLYRVRFQPKAGKVQQLGEGVLYLDAESYGLARFQFASSGELQALTLQIVQESRRIEGRWFPVFTHTVYAVPELEGRFGLPSIVQEHTVGAIEVGALPAGTRFGTIKSQLAAPGIYQQEIAWRPETLTAKDQETYARFDSLDTDERKGLQFLEKGVEFLVQGGIPLGPVDVEPLKLLRFNAFEGFAPGIGLRTNERISSRFRLSGYTRYGFRDRAWKFGGTLEVPVEPHYDTRIFVDARRDIAEIGEQDLPLAPSFSSGSDVFRRFRRNRMDQVQHIGLRVQQRPLPGLQLSLFSLVENRTLLPTFFETAPTSEELLTQFRHAETGITLRYVGNEQVSRVGGRLISWRTAYPIVSLRVSRAMDGFLGGETSLWRGALRVQQQWRTGLATHQVQLAGYGVWGEQVPLSFLQTGFGIRGEPDPEDPRPSSEAGLSLPGYLQTMHVYEFLTDRSLHLSYAFQTAPLIERQLGDVLIGPRLKLHQQYAVGTLENVERYQFFDFQTMEKGFWESGVELPQLVRIKNGSSFYNIGFGYFHRWGAYAFPRAADNGVWVMNLITSF